MKIQHKFILYWGVIMQPCSPSSAIFDFFFIHWSNLLIYKFKPVCVIGLLLIAMYKSQFIMSICEVSPCTWIPPTHTPTRTLTTYCRLIHILEWITSHFIHMITYPFILHINDMYIKFQYFLWSATSVSKSIYIRFNVLVP